MSEVDCPDCGEPTQRVGYETVAHITEPFTNTRVDDSKEYTRCETRDCPVLYASDDGEQVFGVEESRVPVNFKMPEDDPSLPLCYCFGFTKEDVEDPERGGARVVDWITERVRNGDCACSEKNPKGGCCLGDVRPVAEEAEETEGESGGCC